MEKIIANKYSDRNEFGLTVKNMEIIYSILQKFINLNEVKIFGSRAKGTHHLGSDIDLAILSSSIQEIDLRKMKSLFEESNLPLRVDLVYYPNLINTELKYQIDTFGKSIIL